MIPAAVSAPPLTALCDGLKSRRRAERAQIGAAARGRSAVQTEAAARARTCHPAERDELGGSALSQRRSPTSCAEALPGESAGGFKSDQPTCVFNISISGQIAIS